MAAKIGDRVGAIMSADSEKVELFGYGVYSGDVEIPGLPFKNPEIKLDNGRVVRGYECWWGPEDKVKAMIGTKKVIDVIPGAENV